MKHYQILLDWDGPILKKEISRVANMQMLNALGKPFAYEQVDQIFRDGSHIDVGLEAMRTFTGDFHSSNVKRDMTTMFGIFYKALVRQQGKEAFHMDFVDVLLKLRKHYLAEDVMLHYSIVSMNLREVIESSLGVLGVSLFDHVFGNNHQLAYLKKDHLARCNHNPETLLMVDDENNGIEAATSMGIHGGFVGWGAGKEEDILSSVTERAHVFVLNKPSHLGGIVEQLLLEDEQRQASSGPIPIFQGLGLIYPPNRD